MPLSERIGPVCFSLEREGDRWIVTSQQDGEEAVRDAFFNFGLAHAHYDRLIRYCCDWLRYVNELLKDGLL